MSVYEHVNSLGVMISLKWIYVIRFGLGISQGEEEGAEGERLYELIQNEYDKELISTDQEVSEYHKKHEENPLTLSEHENKDIEHLSEIHEENQVIDTTESVDSIAPIEEIAINQEEKIETFESQVNNQETQAENSTTVELELAEETTKSEEENLVEAVGDVQENQIATDLSIELPVVIDQVEAVEETASDEIKLEEKLETPIVAELNDTNEVAPVLNTTSKTVLEVPIGEKKPIIPDVIKTRAEIESFEEWKEIQLQEKAKQKAETLKQQQQLKLEKQAVSNFNAAETSVDEADKEHLLLQRRKNYASTDCGAKLISFNPEANNPSHILSENKDEYMLNACSRRVWFIIELCEPIQITNFELANFELFSNVPK